MGILLDLLILLIIAGVIYAIISLLPLPPQWVRIAQLVLGAFVLIYVLILLFGLLGSGPSYRPLWR